MRRAGTPLKDLDLSEQQLVDCGYNGKDQGYRDRYDIIDHGHEKTTFMCFFHRSIFTETREFANHCFMEVSYKLWL